MFKGLSGKGFKSKFENEQNQIYCEDSERKADKYRKRKERN